MQQLKIKENEAGQRLDKYLQKLLPKASKSFLYKMLRKKNIILNNHKAEGKEILSLNDDITLFFSTETFEKFSQKEFSHHQYIDIYLKYPKLEIIFENAHIMILNKPVGLLSQKAKDEDESINEWFIGYLLSEKKITEDDLATFKPSICNRLDRNTSGLILCGKTLMGSQVLNDLIKKHAIRKFYRTIVHGHLQQEGIIEGYLKKDTLTNKVEIQKKPFKDATYIKTSYEKVFISKKQTKSNFTYLEVELITGKTHQIRAHLASIGHPIIGDYKYKATLNKKELENISTINYQLLHAYRIEFPKDCGVLAELNNQMITAPLTQEFQQILNKLTR